MYFNRIVIPFDVWVNSGAKPNDFITWRGLVQQSTKPVGIKKEAVIHCGLIQIGSVFIKVDFIAER